ncbi:peptidase S24-like family protein [Candidatus Phytoplasma oryzae]|uniref:Peptidase S24-like family protein n=1 Tax=Candidatus Phytoplasma oryzae TaxID=203274 RepID=A0A139JQ78_9MOLU|nr:S26 family signal peptidase [Candidatus Phytoplasma oryzae]KXT29119.1 peptidase S24-like family protein [Candidatus Phytoplasma oryzae]RAM57563.1 hypothetical protein DH96_02485 [Candidatus Phytoplasma oryzae]
MSNLLLFRLKKIFMIFLNFTLNLILFLFFLYVLLILIIPRENILNFFYFQNFQVASNSMYPQIKVGDQVLVKKISKENCHKLRPSTQLETKDGDIVIFKVDPQKFPQFKDKLIIHRVVANNIDQEYITTKGDNNEKVNYFEQKIPYENVLAIKVFQIDYKYVFWFKILVFILINVYAMLYLVNKIFNKNFNKKKNL